MNAVVPGLTITSMRLANTKKTKPAQKKPDSIIALISINVFNTFQRFSTVHLPYRIIKILSSMDMNPFLTSVFRFVTNQPQNSTSPSTSCIQNLMAVSVIFSGKEKTKNIISRLGFNTTIPFNVNHQNETIEYTLDNLFSGPFVIKMAEDLKDREYNNESKRDHYLNQIKDVVLKRFAEFLNDNLQSRTSKRRKTEQADQKSDAKTKVDAFFSNLIFNFNLEAVNMFTKTLLSNSSKTNSESSHIYYMAILEQNSDCTTYFHAFAIEQYYAEAQRKVLYRFYQSWIHLFTLNDFFKMSGYGEEDECCLDEARIKRWCDDFYMIFNNPLDHYVETLYQRCFGTNLMNKPVHYKFHSDDKTLSGLSFRFICKKINPGRTYQNLVSFLHNQRL